MILQVGGAVPTTPWELITTSSVATRVVLVVLTFFSVLSWFLIVLKWRQFRRVRRRADRFFGTVERTTRLEEAYHAVMKLPPSPYGRLLREGESVFSELTPGTLPETGTAPPPPCTCGAWQKASTSSRIISQFLSLCFSTGSRFGDPSPLP